MCFFRLSYRNDATNNNAVSIDAMYVGLYTHMYIVFIRVLFNYFHARRKTRVFISFFRVITVFEWHCIYFNTAYTLQYYCNICMCVCINVNFFCVCVMSVSGFNCVHEII